MECGQRPTLRLPAGQLQNALLFAAAPVHPVRRSPLFPHIPPGLVPLEVLHPRRLGDWLAPDGGAVCLRRLAHFCAAGAVCAVCGDLRPPRNPTETHKVQSGITTSCVFLLRCPTAIGLTVRRACIPASLHRWPRSSAPPASSSAAWSPTTWKTFPPSKPSPSWWLS